ncbi:adenylate/guanylate cyclase domain-containing protein [Rubrivirga sp. IMCC45206]|uniref:adenylate/guanylate cyclase domain-containing protein n=1 Tax=Rubrivirga sp. IMCC45206 TaxID=3391614 RepID=UPI00399028C5
MTVGRARRALRLAPTLIVPWAVFAFVSARLTGVGPPGETLGGAVARSVVVGLLIGSAAAWLESGPLARWGRRLPLWGSLLVRTVSYALVVVAALAGLIALGAWMRGRVGLLTAIQSAQFQQMVSDQAFWVFLGLLMASSFVINFALQLRRVLGPETMRALFLGTYRRPVREQRAFAFLDLTDSTAWAERLGPLAFTDFKNDFFADVAEPVLATGGRIVQYVGDEVMVSWPMRRAERDAAPLRFYFLVEARVAARADRYRDRYGAVPAFKCGVHGGEVVTAEVGDLKRDIVHSGDVVNTAARIEGECRPRGHRLLISDVMLARMPALAEWTHTELGPADLRGKSQSVGLVSITRAG